MRVWKENGEGEIVLVVVQNCARVMRRGGGVVWGMSGGMFTDGKSGCECLNHPPPPLPTILSSTVHSEFDSNVFDFSLTLVQPIGFSSSVTSS